MGSWDVSCSLTGVHIGVGDKAVIIPLSLRENTYDNELDHMRLFGNTNLLSNDGCNVYFQEATYPIFGEYDDYGRIGSIVKDDNTKILEKYFGLKIEKIVSVLTDNRKDEIFYQPDMSDSSKILDMSNPRHAELATYSITWIHGDVYSKLSRAKNTHGGWEEEIDLGVPAVLEELGFTFEGEDKSRERWNQRYVKDGLTVWSDGTWLHQDDNQGLYRFKDLKRYCKKHGVDIDIDSISNKTYYEQQYDYKLLNFLKQKKEHLKMNKEIIKGLKKKDTEEAKKLLELYIERDITMFGSMSDHSSYLLLHKDFRYKKAPNPQRLREHYAEHVKHKSFYRGETEDDIAAFHKSVEDRITALENAEKQPPLSDAYAEAVLKKAGVLRSNISDWFNVKGFFFTLGRVLFPIGTSPQWGDPEATKLVLTAAMEVVDAEIAQHKEWADEEEDEEELEEV